MGHAARCATHACCSSGSSKLKIVGSQIRRAVSGRLELNVHFDLLQTEASLGMAKPSAASNSSTNSALFSSTGSSFEKGFGLKSLRNRFGFGSQR